MVAWDNWTASIVSVDGSVGVTLYVSRVPEPADALYEPLKSSGISFTFTKCPAAGGTMVHSCSEPSLEGMKIETLESPRMLVRPLPSFARTYRSSYIPGP